MDKFTHKVRVANWTENVWKCQSRPSGMKLLVIVLLLAALSEARSIQ